MSFNIKPNSYPNRLHNLNTSIDVLDLTIWGITLPQRFHVLLLIPGSTLTLENTILSKYISTHQVTLNSLRPTRIVKHHISIIQPNTTKNVRRTTPPRPLDKSNTRPSTGWNGNGPVCKYRYANRRRCLVHQDPVHSGSGYTAAGGYLRRMFREENGSGGSSCSYRVESLYGVSGCEVL